MIREKNGRPVVEVYDPALRRKRHIKPSEFDMDFRGLAGRALWRAAQRLEQLALDELDAARPRRSDETCAAFALRWPDDFPGRPDRPRGETAVEHNRRKVHKFAEDFGDRPLASVSREEARRWAQAHPSRLNAVRAMFNDALDVGLVQANPFTALGLARSQGRRDIIVLTADEVVMLSEVARRVHGHDFGGELAAAILWTAYTCLRPGEVYASRYSRLHGDTYDVREQFNSDLRRETAPKYGSDGLIFVPEQARQAVLDKPRRLDDDLMFRTTRGKQFRAASWLWAWEPVRSTFTAELEPSHPLRRRLERDPKDKLDLHELRHFGASHMLNVLGIEPWIIAEQLRHKDGGRLVVTLYGHPSREAAIGRIRGAYGENVQPLRPAWSGDMTKRSAGGNGEIVGTPRPEDQC